MMASSRRALVCFGLAAVLAAVLSVSPSFSAQNPLEESNQGIPEVLRNPDAGGFGVPSLVRPIYKPT